MATAKLAVTCSGDASQLKRTTKWIVDKVNSTSITDKIKGTILAVDGADDEGRPTVQVHLWFDVTDEAVQYLETKIDSPWYGAVLEVKDFKYGA